MSLLKLKDKSMKDIIAYSVLIIIMFLMLYPLIWLFFATFKTNDEIFGSISLLPESFSLRGYIEGWKGSGQYTFTTYTLNTLILVIPVVVFTVFSSSIVAYGFARFTFPFKKTLFALMIATLMLPGTVIIIPRYIMFRNLSWLDSYMPFYAPALLACFPFFIYMMIQFFRGLPKELDESAYMDGASTIRVFFTILLPLLKPALFSAAIFQTIWTWNNFFEPLIYINSISKYPLSLGLRMTLDTSQAIAWDQILAMALVSMLPISIFFFLAQKHFVEGISTTGIK